MSLCTKVEKYVDISRRAHCCLTELIVMMKIILGQNRDFIPDLGPPAAPRSVGAKKCEAQHVENSIETIDPSHVYLWAKGVHCRFYCCVLWFPTLLKKKNSL